RERPDIPVPVRLLAQGQLAHDVVDAAAEARVSGGRVLLRDRGEVVPEGVAGHARLLPSAVARPLGREAGVCARVVKEAVRVERKQVVGVAEHRRPEGAVEEPDVAQREGAGGAGRRLWRLAEEARGERGEQEGGGRFHGGARRWKPNLPGTASPSSRPPRGRQ